MANVIYKNELHYSTYLTKKINTYVNQLFIIFTRKYLTIKNSLIYQQCKCTLINALVLYSNKYGRYVMIHVKEI